MQNSSEKVSGSFGPRGSNMHQRRPRERKYKRSRLAAFALIGAGGLATAWGCGSEDAADTASQAQYLTPVSELGTSLCEGLHLPAPVLSVDWEHGPGLARLASQSAHVVVRSLTNAPQTVTLRGEYAIDALHETREVAAFVLDAGAERRFTVPLALNGASLASLRTSAQLIVAATSSSSSTVNSAMTVRTSPLFYHQDGAEIAAYDKETLNGVFHGGDYKGTLVAFADQLRAQGDISGRPVVVHFGVGRLVPSDADDSVLEAGGGVQ